MKNYLIILLFFVFVSCNQTTITQNNEENTKETELDSLYYADLRLDSLGRVSIDSALLFINQINLQKDTSFIFSYAEIDFFTKKDRFEPFYLLKNSMCLYDKCYLYLVTNQSGKYQILDSLEYENLSSVQNIYLEDVNFDNQKDIVIKSRILSASIIVSFYHLIIQEDFKNVASLLATDSLYINSSKKEILAFRDGGNFGIHEKNFYKWINDSLTLTRYWEKSIDITSKRTIEKFIIKKGKTIKTSYDTLTIQEDDTDLWYAIED